MPYIPPMHGVVLTSTFERQAKALGLDHEQLLDIVSLVSADPVGGDAMPGPGGARKMRQAGQATGNVGAVGRSTTSVVTMFPCSCFR